MRESATCTSVTLAATVRAICGTKWTSPGARVPEEVCVAKPGEVMVSWKAPGVTLAKENSPLSPVRVCWSGDGVWPVLVSFTWAPATMAPLWSTTVPLMCPGVESGAGAGGGLCPRQSEVQLRDAKTRRMSPDLNCKTMCKCFPPTLPSRPVQGWMREYGYALEESVL